MPSHLQPESPFRIQFRQSLPRWYRGELHVVWTVFVLILGVIAGLTSFSHFSGVDRSPFWSEPLNIAFFVFVFFIFAQFFEYSLHRWILHIRRAGFLALYKKHTLEHHRFFTHLESHYSESKDIALVLFPMWAPLLCVAVFSLVMLGLGSAGQGTAGAFLLILSSSYFLFYETLHFIHHLPEDHFIFQVPGLMALRQHHLVHHDPRLMQSKNFGVTLPTFDFILGTKS